MSDYFIARQPIFDASLNLFAYELLFRTSDSLAAPKDLDDDVATAQVLLTSEEVGLSKLVGEHRAFINLPRKFFAEPDLIPDTTGQLVLEMLEHVEPDEEVMQGIRILAQRGHTLALDDYVYDKRWDAVIPFVHIVKLEIPQIDPKDWPREIQRLKERRVKVLAEKVETAEEFEQLSALGCDYFQGYFFAKPKVVTGKRLAPNKLAMLQLLAKVNNSDTDIDELSALVAQDVALSVRAMNYVNSAASALNRRIDSVREAVVYLGRETLRRWVTIFVMAKLDDKPSELITMSLSRAKFLELLADRVQQPDPDVFFTVGLFSMLDAMMDRPMAEVLDTLSLEGELRAALEQHEGNKGIALLLATHIEQGAFNEDDSFDLSPHEVSTLYTQARIWADETLTEMGLSNS
ncbi:MAG: EAL and HDOD domain-containing protein [Congregibacter sp.]